jgi:AcrR family transcriptional regulator
MKITGMNVTSASVSGSRLMRAMLRLVSTSTSEANNCNEPREYRPEGEGAVVDEYDEESWPRLRTRGAWPSPGGASGTSREQRITDHIRRQQARGAQTRPRDRGLSRQEIVAAAIAVADAEGPDAVSMRRIAREVRAGVMSLYWHVASKEELTDLMLDTLEAEFQVPEPTGDWRADLRELAHRQRAGMLRHPWVMEFVASRPPSGPNDARNLELMLGMVCGLGLDAKATVETLMTVVTYVMGAVLREVQEMRTARDQAELEAAMTAEEIQAEREKHRAWFTAMGRFPNIVRMMEQGVDPDAPETRDARFEFGLDCLLDGIAARLPAAG